MIGALKRRINELMRDGPIERMVAVSQTVARIRQSDDLQEGIRADTEKREPHSTGRSGCAANQPVRRPADLFRLEA